MLQLNENEFAHYYKPYIDAVAGNGKSIVENLNDTLIEFLNTLSNISEDKQEYRYAAGKWTIKELIQHLVDSERVFAYRALRFARNDSAELAGFEQDDYVAVFDANARGFDALLEELELTRKSTILLFKSFGEKELMQLGVASGTTMSVRALGCVVSGHLMHHFNIMNERYL
jgi:hypothetical protein